jgi:2-methylisocitrate lyase-like PEP mutase family enzyme
VAEVGALGVKRISTGGLMHAVAMSAMIGAAKEMLGPGTFDFTGSMPHAGEIDALLGRAAQV